MEEGTCYEPSHYLYTEIVRLFKEALNYEPGSLSDLPTTIVGGNEVRWKGRQTSFGRGRSLVNRSRFSCPLSLFPIYLLLVVTRVFSTGVNDDVGQRTHSK